VVFTAVSRFAFQAIVTVLIVGDVAVDDAGAVPSPPPQEISSSTGTTASIKKEAKSRRRLKGSVLNKKCERE
jgi:hypothetical protein